MLPTGNMRSAFGLLFQVMNFASYPLAQGIDRPPAGSGAQIIRHDGNPRCRRWTVKHGAQRLASIKSAQN